jgi:hypothetical protein
LKIASASSPPKTPPKAHRPYAGPCARFKKGILQNKPNRSQGKRSPFPAALPAPANPARNTNAAAAKTLPRCCPKWRRNNSNPKDWRGLAPGVFAAEPLSAQTRRHRDVQGKAASGAPDSALCRESRGL